MRILLSVLCILTGIILNVTKCFGHPAVYDEFMPDDLGVGVELPLLRELERAERADRNHDAAQVQEHNVLNGMVMRRNRSDAQLRTIRRTKN